MLEKILRTPPREKIIKSIKIQGTLASQIQLRGENTKEPYYYAFIRLKGQQVDLPVIFKIKVKDNKIIEPQLKQGQEVELTGHYSTSEKNIRKSFTCLDYQSKKECFGCGDN